MAAAVTRIRFPLVKHLQSGDGDRVVRVFGGFASRCSQSPASSLHTVRNSGLSSIIPCALRNARHAFASGSLDGPRVKSLMSATRTLKTAAAIATGSGMFLTYSVMSGDSSSNAGYSQHVTHLCACQGSSTEPTTPSTPSATASTYLDMFTDQLSRMTGDIEDEKHSLEEGPMRYAVYARRAIQTVLVKGRLVAYTSDVGESVRPVVPKWMVRACYGITWLYVAVDVGYNTTEEYLRGSPQLVVLRTAIHAATFQSIASVALPAFLIHQVVHLVQGALKSMPQTKVVRWLPSVIGLSCIPLMPYIDHPVEGVIDAAFDAAWPVEGHGHKSEGNQH
uniref:Mitochondrial fission process protein 1 n=1 Tax=Chrysotila carterae TaxID=13221 RepID=A0A7S4F6Q6_CHRCT